MISRRRVLTGAPAFVSALAQDRRRPNILFAISDDQSWIHASAYGSKFVSTPAFDRIAREGVLFRNAFVSTPSCAPSRGSVLTGQDFYRLGPGSMNHTEWQRGSETYVDRLAAAGYHTGFTGKGWAPGNFRAGGRTVTPCGPAFNAKSLTPPAPGMSPTDYAGNFEAFLAARPSGAPFCFWAGFIEPHRVFTERSGRRLGKDPKLVDVPGFLPDTPDVRDDIADYAAEIEWYDRQLGRMLDHLEKIGELDNTLILSTSDNGMAFPRAKGNLYEYGVHMPMAARWGARIPAGRVLEEFVSFPDLAPTFLEAAGAAPLASATGRSLLPLLTSKTASEPARDQAVFGIERHFPGSRAAGAGYPSRGVRTSDYLYIRNLTPDRNPVGDHPGPAWPEDDPVKGYGDTDGGLSKTEIWNRRHKDPRLFDLAFGKRPAEELYRVDRDPYCLTNLATDATHAAAKSAMATRLEEHRKRTADPRATGRAAELDAVMTKYPALSSEVNRQETRR